MEDLHDFSDEVGEGHGAGIFSALHEVGLDVRRNELDDFSVGFAKLIAERKRV